MPHKYLKENIALVPFTVSFLTAFVLETSMHRLVFYALIPFLAITAFNGLRTRSELFRTKSFYFICAYIGYFLLSALWSTQGEQSFYRVALDGICIFLFCAAPAVAAPAISLTKSSVTMITGFCLAASLVFTAYFYTGHNFSDRLQGGDGRFENPIHLSILLSFCILMLLSVWAKDGKKTDWLQIGIICLLGLLALMTQTRSSLVAMAGCMALLGAIKGGRVAFIMAGAGIACTIICYFLWGSSLTELYARADTFRFVIWGDVWAHILQKPLFGHGILGEPDFAATFERRGWKSSHNVILGHLFTGGVAGFAILLLLAGNAAIQSCKTLIHEGFNANTPLSALSIFTCLSLCFSAIVSLFNFTHFLIGLHIQWLVFWFPVTLAWYLETRNIEEKKRRLEAAREGDKHAQAP